MLRTDGLQTPHHTAIPVSDVTSDVPGDIVFWVPIVRSTEPTAVDRSSCDDGG